MSEQDQVDGSWDAIDAICEKLYPGQEPQHWGTVQRWRLGGNDPLDGISAYDAGDYWHFISYGMTELYEKESDLKEQSGWGFEFSFRIRKDDSGEPPMWIITLLQTLGRMVFENGEPLGNGHFINAGGAINQQLNSELTGLLLSTMPGTAQTDSLTGKFQILEVLCITDPDVQYCFSDETAPDKLIGQIRQANPDFVNDFSTASSYSDALK